MTAPELETVLGLPDYLSREEARALAARLQELWAAMTGEPCRALEADFLVLRRWFDPVAQGQRLRREVAGLASMHDRWVDPGSPMTLKVAPKKFLVTPEGRCALDILVRLPEREGFVFSQRDFWPYERFLAETYREWSRHRLTSVVDLLGGKTKPLQIAAAGVVVALLVNRSTAPDRALQRYPAGQRRDTVDQAFFSAVEAFAQAIAGERRAKRKDPRLISGWMLYEAGRRLGDALVFSDATEDSDGSVWIRADSIPEVISTVARDLQRGNRTRATASDFGRAFDALVEQLRLELPALAGFGLVHERPVETERLRRDFLSALALQ